jgi:hypothetical protein
MQNSTDNNIDNIVDKILSLASDCRLTTPYHSDILKFKKQLATILLNELTHLHTHDTRKP